MTRERSLFRSVLVRRSSLGAVPDRLVETVRTVAFWLAVLLPLAYPPVLLEVGTARPLVLFGLLALHVLALSVGHAHGRS